MRIISKFKDYYDSSAYAWSGEPSPDVWVRNTEKKIVDFTKLNHLLYVCADMTKSFLEESEAYDDVTSWVIFFCGEYYLMLYTNAPYNPELDKPLGSMLRYYKFSDIEQYAKDKNKYWYRNDLPKEDDLVKLHVEHNAPYFVMSPSRHYSLEKKALIVSPKLDYLYFGKIYNSLDCYMKVDTFFSNYLFKKDDVVVPVGSDKDRIVSAGFDLKTSFRNM